MNSIINRKISLWLLPPETNNLRTNLQHSIDTIASHIPSGVVAPSFLPHVTILGGIDCPVTEETASDQWADEILQELRSTLPCLGGIPCRFPGDGRPIAVKEEGDEGESIKWNQSCISIMERSEQLRKAVLLTHAAVSKVNSRLEDAEAPMKVNGVNHVDNNGVMEEKEFDWTTTLKPPIYEPHYSHAYGSGPDLIDTRVGGVVEDGEDSPFLVQTPPDFVSEDAVLMWTCPATLEGVSDWREIGRLKMV